MKYPIQYLHSDSVVLDTRSKYVGEVVQPRRESLWERGSLLATPMPAPIRKGAEDFKAITSKGTAT
jgi:hypothetical protein